MHLPNNVFAIILIISGIVSISLCFIIINKLGRAVQWFGSIMLAVGIWVMGYGFELSSYTLKAMLFCSDVEYIGIAALPALWLFFIVKFIGKNSWLTVKNIVLVLSEPVLTLIFKWTAAWRLVYASFAIDNSGPFPMLSIMPGWWYRVHVVFFYALLVWGLLLIISRYKLAQVIIKRQIAVIVCGTVLPWLINIAYLFHLRPFRQLDLTPFAFLATSFIVGLGLLRYKLFDIVPVAREKIIEAMQEGVLVIDNYNRIVDLNPQMKIILGDSKGKWIEKNIDELFTGSGLFNNSNLIPENDKTEISREINGQTNYFSVSITPLFEHKNIHSGNLLLFRDITERRHNRQKLEELNQLKDRLFSIIAHDLRSPLLSLMDILTMAGEGIVTDEEFKSFLPNLAKNISYTSSLVENLLFWSKSQLTGMVIKPLRFDAKPVADVVLETYKYLSDEKGVKTENIINDDTFVFCDKDMFQAVLRNLITNAIKFCRRVDTVQIGAKPGDQSVTIFVADTGVGITPENISKLFTLQTFTTRGTVNEQGTGLGLLLCKDFIEKNNGKVWVDSTVNKGTTFYFSLPG